MRLNWGTDSHWRVFGRRWCLQLVTAETANVSASRQTTAYLCALGVGEWTCEWERFPSAATITVLVLLVHKSSQSLTSENRIDEILFHFFFFCFCLRRNSCADSLRGQYARMGPLQYLFLCGLLHTQTYGKFIQCMHLLASWLKGCLVPRYAIERIVNCDPMRIRPQWFQLKSTKKILSMVRD